MSAEGVVALDAESLALFARKGSQHHDYLPQIGDASAVKVRRVMQLVRDLVGKPMHDVRLLDLACGEGVYSIEAALQGATARGMDARTERMDEGAAAAQRLGLANVSFAQGDIREVTSQTQGRFDAILLLGILYHLDGRDILPILKNLYEMCDRMLIVDTHVSLRTTDHIELEGQSYAGAIHVEHSEKLSTDERRKRLLMSLDNPYSFWFTRESLYRLLQHVGFTSVAEVYVPLEPRKLDNRVTYVAIKGQPSSVSTYPWINGKTEAEIATYLAELASRRKPAQRTLVQNAKKSVQSLINGALKPFGFKLTRL